MNPLEEAAVFDFRDLWHADAAKGRARSLADYQGRFPAFQDRIAAEWTQLSSTGGAAGTTHAEEPEQLGPYRLLRLLGRGGQGSVWLAEDARVQHRRVALKVLDPLLAGLSAARVDRLRREAEALARLDHPGVCAMLDVQLDGARPFLAMRFVDGETLQARLAGSPPPRTMAELHRVLSWIERAALAAHAAHETGIVHRDIKPANIILDRDDRPVLLDFGLARDEEQGGVLLTLSGDVFGTLAYMAPEQIAGLRDLDRRVDVYALGVTLYECVTGARPFRATSRESLSADIRTGHFPDPRTLNPALPRDLAVVIRKAMDLARDRRYASARAFADDLANMREYRPIRARPAGVALRAWRWTQRHPAAATALAVLTVALLGLSTLTWRLQAQTSELLAWKRAMTAVADAESDPGKALDEALTAAVEYPHHEIRTALHRVLAANRQVYEVPAGQPRVPDSGIAQFALLDDRHTLVALDGPGTLLTWDSRNGHLLQAIPTPHGWSGWCLVLRDGQHVATVDSNGGAVLLWTQDQLRSGIGKSTALPHDPRPPHCTARDEAGGFYVGGEHGRLQHCASASTPAWEQPWDLGDRTIRHVWPNPQRDEVLIGTVSRADDGTSEQTLWHCVRSAPPTLVAAFRADDLLAEWSPIGSLYAVATNAGVLQLRTPDGALAWATDSKVTLNSVHFVPDGRRVVTFGFDGLLVRNVDSPTVVAEDHSSTGRSFENCWFAPDGALAAVAVRDSTLAVYDTRSWQRVTPLGRTHVGYVRQAAWSDNLLIALDHGALLGFAVGYRADLPELHDHRAPIRSLAFHPDGRLLASAADDRLVVIHDLATGERVRTLAEADAVRVCGGVERLLVVTRERVARLWPWRDGPPIELRGHEDEVTDGWFLSGGSKVLTIGADATARLWSSTDGALLRTFRSELGPLCLAAVDEQAGLLAVTGKEARLQLFALATGAPLRTCSTHSGFRGREGTTPTCIAFDPQNHHLYLSALDTSTVLCFDRNRDWATMELDGVGSGSTGWALPDPLGKVVICTEYVLGNTRWFDARTQLGLPWDTAWQPGTKISRVAFSPDGSVALLASWDGTVHLLDLRTLQPWSVLRSDQGAMDAAFSPDGNAVAVGHRDGTIRVWPVDPLPAARAHRVRRQPQ